MVKKAAPKMRLSVADVFPPKGITETAALRMTSMTREEKYYRIFNAANRLLYRR